MGHMDAEAEDGRHANPQLVTFRPWSEGTHVVLVDASDDDHRADLLELALRLAAHPGRQCWLAVATSRAAMDAVLRFYERAPGEDSGHDRRCAAIGAALPLADTSLLIVGVGERNEQVSAVLTDGVTRYRPVRDMAFAWAWAWRLRAHSIACDVRCPGAR